MEKIRFREHNPEQLYHELEAIERLVSKDLSEPYSIYVYQYFIRDWPSLYLLAETEAGEIVGTIVGSVREHKNRKRGYIAMLAVSEAHRGKGIAKELIRMLVKRLIDQGGDEVILETEVSNKPALALYQNLGFIRTRRMHRYYLNTSDAFRLVLPLTEKSTKSTVYARNEGDPVII